MLATLTYYHPILIFFIPLIDCGCHKGSGMTPAPPGPRACQGVVLAQQDSALLHSDPVKAETEAQLFRGLKCTPGEGLLEPGWNAHYGARP